MNQKIKIAIAEDYELERNGFIALLKEYADFEIVLAVANGKDLLEGLKTITPDIILLDIEMKIMGGKETFDKLRVKHPKIKVIMLTEHFQDSYIVEYINKGAKAFLSKNTRIEKLVESIRSVHVNGQYYDSIVTNILSKSNVILEEDISNQNTKDNVLSARELDVLKLMCKGKRRPEIAEILFLNVRTVDKHTTSIWEKTNCTNLVELIDYAFKHNLISV